MGLGRHLAGLAAAGIGLAGGAWLLLAPWVLGFPGPSGAWGRPMLAEFWSGAGLAAAAALAAVVHGAAISAELRQPVAAPSRRSRGRAAGRHGRGGRGTGTPAAPTGRGPGGGPPAPAAAAAGGGPAARAGVAPGAQGGPTPERPEIDALLVPIATALLADLARRQGGGPSAGDERPGSGRPSGEERP